MTILNEMFNIVRKIELLINTTNNFILFRCFEIFYVEKIVNENKYIKTQFIIIENKKFMFLKINAFIFLFQFDKKKAF